MRGLKEYSVSEWLRLVPVALAYKQVRNDIWLEVYKRARPKSLDRFLEGVAHLRDRNIALVVAFEQPWALDWLLRMARRNLADTTILVFDNSRRPEARQKIEQVCREHQTPYLALPVNSVRHVNRSHGMAMTWIFYNVVHAIKPRMFAFLDHDMIPVCPTEFTERLGGQPFFGWKRSTYEWPWNLWAGYLLLDYAQVAGLPMNFLYDFSRGLDTGGRNWNCLYRRHDSSRFRFATNCFTDIRDPETGEPHKVQIVDGRWLHIGGIGYNDNFRNKSLFCEHLAAFLDRGESWPQLLAAGTVSTAG